MLYLASFSSYNDLFVKSCRFNTPHLHLAPTLGVTPLNLAEIFGIKKVESLGYRVALFVYPKFSRFVTISTCD